MALAVVYASDAAIQLYDPRYTESQERVGDTIEYFTSGIPQSSFLEEGMSADPDVQVLSPHRLECSCSFRKANPLGRVDSYYHVGKDMSSELNPLSKAKLEEIQRSRAASGSKVTEVRNLLPKSNPAAP